MPNDMNVDSVTNVTETQAFYDLIHVVSNKTITTIKKYE